MSSKASGCVGMVDTVRTITGYCRTEFSIGHPRRCLRYCIIQDCNCFFFVYVAYYIYSVIRRDISAPPPPPPSEILAKVRRRKKPWVTKDVLDLCDERRDLKKKRYEAEGANNTGKQTGGFRRQ